MSDTDLRDGSFGAALDRVIEACKDGTLAEAEVEYVVEREGTEARLSVIVHRQAQTFTWPEARGFAQGGIVPPPR